VTSGNDGLADWSPELSFAHELAHVAGPLALEFFGSSTNHLKDDGTPVGEADMAVDHAICELIKETYPEDGIVSEESAPRGDSDRRWILDPVEGTVQFLEGGDEWGIHIALEEDGEIILGVIYRPLRAQIYWAERGGGAWLGVVDNGQIVATNRLQVSNVGDLSSSRVSVWPTERRPDLVERLKRAAIWIEPYFGVALKLLHGDLEAVCACAGGIWDHAPVAVLLEEAGGTYSDFRGGRRLDLGGGIFTNGKIDRELAPIALRA
jgi:histidinol-phosphatase